MKKNIFYIFLTVNLLLSFSSCDTTEPPPIIPPKDPRTYTWTIDTLINSFQTDLTRIWGSAPNDVYIGGHNAGFPGALWHFDGGKWTPINLPVTTHDVNGIYGFASNDVWVVGETATDFSLILHFNGTSLAKLS